MLRQHARGLMRADQVTDDANVVGDAARVGLFHTQELHLGNGTEFVRIGAQHRVALGRNRLEIVELDVTEPGDREVALVGLAQPDSEIGFPARELDVLARGGGLGRQGGVVGPGLARRKSLARGDRTSSATVLVEAIRRRPTGPARLSPTRPISAACAAIASTCARTASQLRVGRRWPSTASNSGTPRSRWMRASLRPTVVSSMRSRALAPA